MLIRRAPDLRWSDVTPKAHYLRRREFIRAAAVPLVAGAAGWVGSAARAEAQGGLAKLTFTKSPLSTTGETLTPYADITTYNNFYEFGIDKDSPSRFAKSLRPRPWTVTIDGAVAKGGQFAIDDLIKPYQLEERVYRLRCVEALVDGDSVDWLPARRPHAQGRTDRRRRSSSSSPRSTIPSRCPACAAGRSTGRTSKGCGSTRRCTRWRFWRWASTARCCRTRTARRCGWSCRGSTASRASSRSFASGWSRSSRWARGNASQPSEYGFYSNVNPEVDHPRWTQARERRIGEFFKRKTLMFNGYGDQVGVALHGDGPEEELLELQIADCRLQIADCGLRDCGLALA